MRIDQCRNIIVSPPTASEIFTSEVKFCNTNESLAEIMKRNIDYTHLPVYDSWNFIWVINEKTIAKRLISQLLNNKKLNIKKSTINEIPILDELKNYRFIKTNTNIHDILHMFIEAKNTKSQLNALFISDTWEQDWSLVGIITSGDLALIEDHFLHKIVV